MTDRAFPNPYPDHSGQSLLTETGQLEDDYLSKLQAKVKEFVSLLEKEKPEKEDSVYVGSAGIALLYLHLHKILGKDQGDAHLQKALTHLQQPLSSLSGRRLSFLCGDAGPLALGAIIYHKLGSSKESRECINKLEKLHVRVVEDQSLPDEMLFGRTGYLYSLLLLQRELGTDSVDSKIVSKVVQAVISSGEQMSKDEGWSHPLMYAWHDKHYLGAAHGLAGIFSLLMQVKEPMMEQILVKSVKPSIDYMLTLRFPSGNCPSSLGSSSGDKLVQWCHGAPGWIHMFILAYKTFKEEKYLEAAKACADVIWKRGLLKKGYGLCHGTAGNAYSFLAMYQLTKDQMYIYKACKFADWCFDYGKHGCNIPDRPNSLFEGLAGMIYFLSDMLNPNEAKFPAFML